MADPGWALQPSHACRSTHTTLSVGPHTCPLGTLKECEPFSLGFFYIIFALMIKRLKGN